MSSIIIGSRGSSLALQQSHHIRNLLQSAHPHLGVEIKTIQSLGDNQQETPLPEIGAKGLFTAEIESELLSQKIDLAVHSLKDLPSTLPDGLTYAGSPKREDARDVLSLTSGDLWKMFLLRAPSLQVVPGEKHNFWRCVRI